MMFCFVEYGEALVNIDKANQTPQQIWKSERLANPRNMLKATDSFTEMNLCSRMSVPFAWMTNKKRKFDSWGRWQPCWEIFLTTHLNDNKHEHNMASVGWLG